MDEIDKLKKKGLESRKNTKEVMGMYHETIDKEIFLNKRFFPLHMKL
jgi:hypothetical protein